MTILKKQIYKKTKGSLAEREDWWYLCYDTDRREFFIEHEWDHVNAYKISEAANTGTTQSALEGYAGPGDDQIEGAKALLLQEAGHS